VSQDIFLLFFIFTIECRSLTILLCSHHFSLLASRRSSDQTTILLSHHSRRIANDHFVSISSKQMVLTYSQNLQTKEFYSQNLLESTDHMYSTVNMNMRSNEPNPSTKGRSISNLSHHSSLHSSSILRQVSRSSMSVLLQDPRRHSSL
jgi:hypothetical protein